LKNKIKKNSKLLQKRAKSWR